MENGTVQLKLCEYVEDAHAMELSVLRMLDSMIATTGDPWTRRELEQHRSETERHEQRLLERLESLGRGASARKDIQSTVVAVVKSLADQIRTDKAGKNARDGFVTEHEEIAGYELLRRLANRPDEQATSNWDRFVELTLEEEGVPTSSMPGRRETTLERVAP